MGCKAACRQARAVAQKSPVKCFLSYQLALLFAVLWTVRSNPILTYITGVSVRYLMGAVPTEMFVPPRWADQPRHVLRAHPPTILARVVRRPGGLPLQRHHRGQRLALEAPRPRPLLPHGHFPGRYALKHFTHSHATRPAIVSEWPHGPLAVRLWHGHRVFWNRPAEVLTKHTHTLIVHTTYRHAAGGSCIPPMFYLLEQKTTGGCIRCSPAGTLRV